MGVYRISREKYSGKLFSSGAANRWNNEQEFVIYTASSRSLASLEFLVHRNAIKPLDAYKVLIISISERVKLFDEVTLKALPADWQTISSYPLLQELGSKWYKEKKTLVLKVPSAIIPQECNYMINTKHPDFKKYIRLERIEDYLWDERLLKRK